MYRQEVLLDKLNMVFPDHADIPYKIEQSLFEFSATESKTKENHWDTPAFIREYATNARKIIYNLTIGGNRENLLKSIDSGHINPEEIVQMDHRELYPELWSKYFKKVENAPDEVAPDHKGMIKCRKCKSWRTSFYSFQVKSADEPTSLYFTCYDCGNRWRM